MEQLDTEELLAEVDVLLREGIDLFATDPDATVRTVRLLTAAACYLNVWLREQYGGHMGDNRGVELVERIVGAAFQTFGGEDPHSDPFEKAAMLLRGITQGHPFGDGNKRTGFALAAYYLHLLDIDRPMGVATEEEIYAFNMAVSAGDVREHSCNWRVTKEVLGSYVKRTPHR